MGKEEKYGNRPFCRRKRVSRIEDFFAVFWVKLEHLLNLALVWGSSTSSLFFFDPGSLTTRSIRLLWTENTLSYSPKREYFIYKINGFFLVKKAFDARKNLMFLQRAFLPIPASITIFLLSFFGNGS